MLNNMHRLNQSNCDFRKLLPVLKLVETQLRERKMFSQGFIAPNFFELFLQLSHHFKFLISSSVSILQCIEGQLSINSTLKHQATSLCIDHVRAPHTPNLVTIKCVVWKCFVGVSSPLIPQQKTRHAYAAKECKPFDSSQLINVGFIMWGGRLLSLVG